MKLRGQSQWDAGWRNTHIQGIGDASRGQKKSGRQRTAMVSDPEGLTPPHASSRIIAAAFSAIIRVGELVLPEVMVGMMEASATRRPARPRTFRRGSTTAVSSLPILQVPTGWKMVVEMSPAAFASSSSLWKSRPGRNSSGRYFASAGMETMLRVTRTDTAATCRSSAVAR